MAKSDVDRERTGRVGVHPAGASAAGQRTARYLLTLDLVIMLALTAFGLGNLLAGAWRPPQIVPIWAVVLILLLASLPVVLRQFWPAAAFRGGLVAGVAAILVGGQWAVALDIGLALYVVVAQQSRRRGILNLALALAITLLTPLVSVGPDTLGQIGFSWAVLIACAATGIAVQERRGRVESNILRRERQAVADERLRIARELHDIVAHSMSLITVKAAVANHVAGQHPEEAQEALRVIEAASRDGLAELRRMLGVLRSEDEPTGDLAPAPTVADLAGLVERAASAGVTTSLDVRGADALPEAIGLTVYRIVQEAVTNVVKHAAPANCAVTVEVADGRVRVEVADNGAAREPTEGDARPGHGLIGMRERVMTYAGSFAAGPRPGGGFIVTAILPFEPASAGALEVTGDRSDGGSHEDRIGAEDGATSPMDTDGVTETSAGETSASETGVGESGLRETSSAGPEAEAPGDARPGEARSGDDRPGNAGPGEAKLGDPWPGGAGLGNAGPISAGPGHGGYGMRDAGLGDVGLGGATAEGATADGSAASGATSGCTGLDDARLGRRGGERLGEAGLNGAAVGGAATGGAATGGAATGDARPNSAGLGDAGLGGAVRGGAELGSARLGGARLGDAGPGDAGSGGVRLGGAGLGGAELGDAAVRGAGLGRTALGSSALGSPGPGGAGHRAVGAGGAGLDDAAPGYAAPGYAAPGCAGSGYASPGDVRLGGLRLSGTGLRGTGLRGVGGVEAGEVGRG